jgi:hypothetical protein
MVPVCNPANHNCTGTATLFAEGCALLTGDIITPDKDLICAAGMPFEMSFVYLFNIAVVSPIAEISLHLRPVLQKKGHIQRTVRLLRKVRNCLSEMGKLLS